MNSAILLALAMASATTVGGCTTRKSATSDAPLPIVNVSPVPQPGENIEALVVQISNGHFEHDVYAQQPGATRLVLRTQGGPYLFSIDGLVDRRELAANAETVVLYSVTDPGRYTMHAALSTSADPTASEATATLDVRPIGGR